MSDLLDRADLTAEEKERLPDRLRWRYWAGCMGDMVPHLTTVTKHAAFVDCLAWLRDHPECCLCFACKREKNWREGVNTISGAWLCMDCFRYDERADAIGSFRDATAEIGRRVKAGEEPVPTT